MIKLITIWTSSILILIGIFCYVSSSKTHRSSKTSYSSLKLGIYDQIFNSTKTCKNVPEFFGNLLWIQPKNAIHFPDLCEMYMSEYEVLLPIIREDCKQKELDFNNPTDISTAVHSFFLHASLNIRGSEGFTNKSKKDVEIIASCFGKIKAFDSVDDISRTIFDIGISIKIIATRARRWIDLCRLFVTNQTLQKVNFEDINGLIRLFSTKNYEYGVLLQNTDQQNQIIRWFEHRYPDPNSRPSLSHAMRQLVIDYDHIMSVLRSCNIPKSGR